MTLNLNPSEIQSIKLAISSNDDLPDELYDKLYEHYSNNGEMPYGTAKARDGDPYNWISDKLEGLVQGS